MLVARFGGDLRGFAAGADARARVERVLPVDDAGAGDLAPLLRASYAASAARAAGRGAVLLVDAARAGRSELAGLAVWVHPFASWALAGVLDLCARPIGPPQI